MGQDAPVLFTISDKIASLLSQLSFLSPPAFSIELDMVQIPSIFFLLSLKNNQGN